MSSDNARRYLVSYDVADDRRRARIAAKLQSYGDRVQYSVFVVDVKPARFVRLRADPRRLISEQEDSILLCGLGPVGQVDGATIRVPWVPPRTDGPPDGHLLKAPRADRAATPPRAVQ